MIIIGLDIASYKTGWFAMDIYDIKFKIGLMQMSGSTEDRIRSLYQQSKVLFDKYEPSMLIIESTYLDEHNKHIKGPTKKRGSVNTLKILEKCHGAVIAATNELIDIHYMTPTEHKELITGMGSASKRATVWSIQKKLGLDLVGEDEADAASLVFAHLMKRQQWNILEDFNTKFSKE
jgi:Holliday junction resolvasome RuvABC endonuclease subunit